MEARKEDIPLLPGLLDRGGLEGAAHAVFAAVSRMQREMAPPRAVVIPQVVVGILRVRAQ